MSRNSDQQNNAENEKCAEYCHCDGPPKLLHPLRQTDRPGNANSAQWLLDLVAAVNSSSGVDLHAGQRRQQIGEHCSVAHWCVKVVAQLREAWLDLLPKGRVDGVGLKIKK